MSKRPKKAPPGRQKVPPAEVPPAEEPWALHVFCVEDTLQVMGEGLDPESDVTVFAGDQAMGFRPSPDGTINMNTPSGTLPIGQGVEFWARGVARSGRVVESSHVTC